MCSHGCCPISGVSLRVLATCCWALTKHLEYVHGIFLVGAPAVEHGVALSSSLVAMYSAVASNCLYNAWPDYITWSPELKAFVHYDSKCCHLVPYVYLWGSPSQLMCCYSVGFSANGQKKLLSDGCWFKLPNLVQVYTASADSRGGFLPGSSVFISAIYPGQKSVYCAQYVVASNAHF